MAVEERQLLEPEESPQPSEVRARPPFPWEDKVLPKPAHVLRLPSSEVLRMDSPKEQAETILLGEIKLGGGYRELSSGGS